MAESEQQPHSSHSTDPDISLPHDKRPKIGTIGNVEFEQLEVSDLQPVSTLTQAFDNQWLPRELLKKAFTAGAVTGSIEQELEKAMRAEYIYSLLNSQQVILNRAFLYNNPVIAQDYAQHNVENRAAFKDLLKEGVIVPYLLGEQTPADPPASGAQATSFETINFEAWKEFCQEIRTRCVRLSWDDEENKERTRYNLSARFNEFVGGQVIAEPSHIDTYLHDLGLDESERSPFISQLHELTRYCQELGAQNLLPTRNQLYKRFVTAGENPAERRYDKSKPFAAEIKQLLDLVYNRNLPDALGGRLITPVGTLLRTTLREDGIKKGQSTDGDKLLYLLKNTRFQLVGQSLNIVSLSSLSLNDVHEIRRMDEWMAYMESLSQLLRHPDQFADGQAAKVYNDYIKLARQITQRVEQQGKSNILSIWSPSVKLVFDIAGAQISCTWTDEGPIYETSKDVFGLVSGTSARVIARLIIRDMSEEEPQQDLSTAYDFAPFIMQDAKRQWEEIKKEIQKQPGYRLTKEKPDLKDSTINNREPAPHELDEDYRD